MTDEEKKDQEEFENLKIGYDLLQKDYVIQDRYKLFKQKQILMTFLKSLY